MKPAGLTQTTLGGSPKALGYAGEENATIRHPVYPSAAAGAVSSVGDVARFPDLLTAGKILDRRDTRAVETVRSDVEGEDCGLGLLVRKMSRATAYGQVGENAGYPIQASTAPAKARTGVVAVTSGAAGPTPSNLRTRRFATDSGQASR